MPDLHPGDVVWAWVDPTRGREQSGRRPVVVVASEGYLDVVTTLAVVVPVSTVDRGWPNHVRLRGLPDPDPSFAMTEQPRTITRERLADPIGQVDDATLDEISTWLSDFHSLG